MVQYTGYVATPANTAHGTSWVPRLEVRLLEEAHHGGSLINTDVVYFTLPSSGAYTVDLIPSDQLRSRSGRPALYHVSETWMSEGGQPMERSDWGTFYLTSDGGTLSDHPKFPSDVPAVFVQEADPATIGSVAKNSIWLRPSTGQIRRMD